jgi:hypothetical protein
MVENIGKYKLRNYNPETEVIQATYYPGKEMREEDSRVGISVAISFF